MGFFAKIRMRWRSYTPQERIVLSFTYILLFLWAVWTLVPLLFTLFNAIKDVKEYYRDPMAFPSYIKWENFSLAMQLEYRNNNVLEMFFNSLVFITTFTASNIGASLLTAYTLARYNFPGKNFLYSLIIVVQIVPIFGTGGSAYLVADKLGLVDNLWLLWITAFSAFDLQCLIMYSYFVNIDKSYAEAARMDGASQFTIFSKIMIPMVMPPIMIMALSSVISHWNNFSTPIIYMPWHPTIVSGIYNLQKSSQYVKGGITAFFAGILICSLPMVAFFLATHRGIFKIDTSGGVKG